MANLPENTTDPILRPVTRLETTTKVFGGEYIPDDEQQRGISNLQAIELAERDQYIISRVGQAKVDPSGDIPGEPGIASLDTSGKLPKAQNTSGVVFTSDVQTLTNKTMDKAFNTVTCSPTVISSATTLTPAKEMNAVISAALTLGNGPYIGYTLPVTATAATTVTYVSANGTVTDNLDAGQTVNYIWKGSYWGSVSNASLPVFISTTQTVEPTMDMNYVVDNTGIVLTVDSGAYIGHKVSVTATANCSVAYLGADGATTLAIAQYYRAELTWNGSYWLVELFAVVEGLDAQGNPFTYGGTMSIAALPLNILNLVYPVGSIYLSTVDSSPGLFIGGSWERLKDTFLLGAGDTYTAGDTGGEATHTLTVNEMPSHSHFNYTKYSTAVGNFSPLPSWTVEAGVQDNTRYGTALAGGGQPHNNMPPYLVVYMWKRIA